MAFQDPFATTQAYSQPQAATGFDAGLRSYMLRIYNYMASALALTGIVAMLAAGSPAFMQAMYNVQGNHVGLSGLGWLVMLAPVGLVMWLSFGLQSLSVRATQAIYWAYAVLIGLSLSSIFLAYTGTSIARAFFVTAGTFGAMSLYGYTTKKDLTRMGSFLIMGLFGIIIASIVNVFLHSSGLNFALSIMGVGIFIGLTAYDTQKLRDMYYQMGGGGDMAAKMSIMGALRLYLDFINIFLYMLRFMGDQRR
jgi:FtsH-binding integral membrane protein